MVVENMDVRNRDTTSRMAKRTKSSRKATDPYEHLRSVDPKLATVIDRVGPCPLAEPLDSVYSPAYCFEALVRAIVSQQLSTKAAATIFSRVAALGANGFPSPDALASTPSESLRAVGLSEAKTRAVHDLAAHVLDGRLPLERLRELDDEAVIEALVAVRGIGRWTAEMFLMFRLHRPDVLSTADLGLRKGMMGLYRLRSMPSPEVMQKRAELWRPYRTLGCWYLWRVAETLPATVRKPSASSGAARTASRAR